jgi:hypothetical protein
VHGADVAVAGQNVLVQVMMVAGSNRHTRGCTMTALLSFLWWWRLGVSLLARGKHLPQHAHQRAILQGSGDPLLVSQLLVDLHVGAVRALLDADVDAEARGQGLLEAHADAKTDDSGQGAVGDGGRDLDDDGADGGQRRRGRQNADVGQVDDGQRAEGQRVLGVANGGNEVCHAESAKR